MNLELNELADEITDEGTSLTFSPVLRQAIVQANDGQNVTIRIGGSTVDVPSTRALWNVRRLGAGDVVWIVQQGPIFIILGTLGDGNERIRQESGGSVIEVGQYLDFHTDGTLDGEDYDARLNCSGVDTLTLEGADLSIPSNVLSMGSRVADNIINVYGTDYALGIRAGTLLFKYSGNTVRMVGGEGIHIDTGWIRTYGSTGWYNQTYGVGINCPGTSAWVQTYGGAGFIALTSGIRESWDNQTIRAENNGNEDTGYAINLTGAYASRETLHRNNGYMYCRNGGQGSLVHIADHIDESSREIKQAVRSLREKETYRGATFRKKIKDLRPIVYRQKRKLEDVEKWNEEFEAGTWSLESLRQMIHDDEIDRLGLIAEEVEEVFPEAVRRDANGTLVGMQYGRLVVPLIEAVREADDEIEALTARVDSLEARLARLESRLPAANPKLV